MPVIPSSTTTTTTSSPPTNFGNGLNNSGTQAPVSPVNQPQPIALSGIITPVQQSEIAKNNALTQKHEAQKRMFDWFRRGGAIVGILVAGGFFVWLYTFSIDSSAKLSRIETKQDNLQSQFNDLKAKYDSTELKTDQNRDFDILQSEIDRINGSKK